MPADYLHHYATRLLKSMFLSFVTTKFFLLFRNSEQQQDSHGRYLHNELISTTLNLAQTSGFPHNKDCDSLFWNITGTLYCNPILHPI
jgi:hypothetical protein